MRINESISYNHMHMKINPVHQTHETENFFAKHLRGSTVSTNDDHQEARPTSPEAVCSAYARASDSTISTLLSLCTTDLSITWRNSELCVAKTARHGREPHDYEAIKKIPTLNRFLVVLFSYP